MPWRTSFARAAPRRRAPVTVAERAFVGSFLAAHKVLAGSASLSDLETALEERNPGKAAAAFDWRAFGRELSGLDPHLRRAFKQGARLGVENRVAKATPAGLLANSLDLENPRSVAWNDQNGARLVVEISSQQMQTIQDFVAQSLRSSFAAGTGMDVRALARQLRSVVGLHSRFATAVSNYQVGLLEGGMSAEQAAGMADQYATRLLNLRAQTIARTEIQTAQTQGRIEGWNQIFDAGLMNRSESGKSWQIADDERTCEQCLGLDGETVGIDSVFSDGTPEPPAHPMCRCDLLLVPLSER